MYQTLDLAVKPNAPLADTRLPAPILSVKGATLQYKTKDYLITATHRVSFDVYRGDRFILLGPSGCGKSTLLKAVGGFIRPIEGAITLNGRTIDQPGPDRMMVFQEFDQLLPWMTVRQNVAFPLLRTGAIGRARVKERVDYYLAKVNLTKFADSYPHMLSGGMKQRVAIARGLAMEPDILLMDEPFASLDALTRRKMQDEVLRLWEEVKFTVLFVTHSVEEAILIGSRILVLTPHPGRVRAELNAHDFGHGHQMDGDFLALQRKINDLLFSDAVEPGMHGS
jgi:NitT/TauT family transport system ATP-binding protein